MKALTVNGRYQITEEMRKELDDFYGNYASEEETAETIRRIYEECGYVIDTHTAVAASVYDKYRKETGDETKTIIASTASPYKFTRSVMEAIDRGKYAAMDDFALIDALEEVSQVSVPRAVKELKDAPVLHDTTVEADYMSEIVKKILGV